MTFGALPEFAPPQQAEPDVGAAASLLETPKGQTIRLQRLAPEAALRRLELTIVRRLEGFLQGDHLGLLPGPGSEPGDARIYAPGQDDVRRMDWAVTARTTVPHVRDTVADRELEIWALLDVTPSMNWGTAGVTKRDLGIAAIATIGFIAQRVGDRFGGLILKPDEVKALPARTGRSALYGLLGKMLEESIVPDHAPGDLNLAEGIEELLRRQRRRGLRVVVSDFLTAGEAEVDPSVPPAWERALRRLAVRNQVLCIEIVDAAELAFPDVGDILIRDPETEFSRYVNTSDPKARELVDAASRKQRDRVAIALKRAGVAHLQLATDRDWVQDIAHFVLNYRRTATYISQPPQGVSR
ncbi:MAG: DUF58 domain-containing protein [Propionibacteriaceae bacterium]|jgi:uncharacterized protein (DUF58 family)|nr:DUF58 domain-containing protein [Propionibacteriaceae bacterium]